MKTAYDCSHVRSVHAVALLYEGREAGKIVGNFSDNPNGAVCTVTVSVWAGPLQGLGKATARAGGCGYCKWSAAIDHAIRRGIAEPDPYYPESADSLKALEVPDMAGAGFGRVRSWLESLGYQVVEVI